VKGAYFHISVVIRDKRVTYCIFVLRLGYSVPVLRSGAGLRASAPAKMTYMKHHMMIQVERARRERILPERAEKLSFAHCR
jgi:hypothetical protein